MISSRVIVTQERDTHMLPNLGALSLNAPYETPDVVPTDVLLDDWREAIRRHEDPEDDFRLPEGIEEDDDCAICMAPLKGRTGDARAGNTAARSSQSAPFSAPGPLVLRGPGA